VAAQTPRHNGEQDPAHRGEHEQQACRKTGNQHVFIVAFPSPVHKRGQGKWTELHTEPGLQPQLASRRKREQYLPLPPGPAGSRTPRGWALHRVIPRLTCYNGRPGGRRQEAAGRLPAARQEISMRVQQRGVKMDRDLPVPATAEPQGGNCRCCVWRRSASSSAISAPVPSTPFASALRAASD